MTTPHPTSFLTDEMLTGLARWMRAAGYDTETAPKGVADRTLVQQAARQNRLLLTRDRAIPEHRAATGLVMVIQGEGMEAWATQLAQDLHLDWLHAPFSRCLACNTPLDRLPAHAARLLPPDALPLGPTRWCEQCEKPYWRGGHVRRMEDRLARWSRLQRH